MLEKGKTCESERQKSVFQKSRDDASFTANSLTVAPQQRNTSLLKTKLSIQLSLFIQKMANPSLICSRFQLREGSDQQTLVAEVFN